MAKFSELTGTFTDKFSKLLIKMAQIVKSAIIADIHDVQICFQQKLTGIIDFNFIQVFEDAQAGRGLEKPAGRGRCHVDQGSNVLQPDILPVILHQVLMDAFHPLVRAFKLAFHIFRAGQVYKGFTLADQVHDLIYQRQPLHRSQVRKLKHQTADLVQGISLDPDTPLAQFYGPVDMPELGERSYFAR